MAKYQYSIRCPLCQKSSVLQWFDRLDDDDAFLVQIREVAGNKGFPIRQEYEFFTAPPSVQRDLEDLGAELARRIKILYDEFEDRGFYDNDDDNEDE